MLQSCCEGCLQSYVCSDSVLIRYFEHLSCGFGCLGYKVKRTSTSLDYC